MEICLCSFPCAYTSPLNILSQTNQANQPSNTPRSHLRTLGIVGLILVTILSLGYAGYTSLNPHVATVTQQQLVTNTQNLYSTQTVTTATTTATTTTSSTTTTSTSTTTEQSGYGFMYEFYPPFENPPYSNCGTYCPPPGSTYYLNNYNSCNLSYASYNEPSSNNMVSCYGYLYQDSAGCTDLVVPIANPYYLESPVYQFLNLHNMPSNSPPLGSWVTVTGQVYQGYSAGPSGAACPLNYINVTSITQ